MSNCTKTTRDMQLTEIDHLNPFMTFSRMCYQYYNMLDDGEMGIGDGEIEELLQKLPASPPPLKQTVNM